jgi:broad specificity phosphatase PhoE
MRKKDFYIFRHGQTDLNVRGVWQGAKIDALLNAKGKEQAKELAKKVDLLQLTNLYTSPLLRAVQTANILATEIRNGMVDSVTILQDLRECNFGICEGWTMEKARERYGADFVQDILFPTQETWGYRFWQGESKEEVFKRVKRVLMHIFGSLLWEGYDRIGIVTHAGVISALQCGFGFKNVNYDNCSILHLSYEAESQEWCQIFD